MKRSHATECLMTLALVCLSVPLAESAETSHFYWRSINVQIDVQEDGDIWVDETQEYVFTGPATTERFRWLPLDGTRGIDNIEVFEEGRPVHATTDVERNRQWIRWQHDLDPPSARTFVLRYRVRGALRFDKNRGRLVWKSVAKHRVAPIDRAQVTVVLPVSLAEKLGEFSSFGIATDARLVDATTVRFVSRDRLPPGKGLEVRLSFSSSSVDASTPGSAWGEEPGALLERVIGGFMFVTLLAFLVGVLWRIGSLGREKTKEDPPRKRRRGGWGFGGGGGCGGGGGG